MNFVLRKNSNHELSKAAEVYDAESGRFMEVYTTEPGVQLCTVDYLDGSIIGSGNIVCGKSVELYPEVQYFTHYPTNPIFHQRY